MKSRTSWREKLEKQEPRLVDVSPKMSRFGKGTMLIPTPLLVDGLIRKVPKGKLITVSEQQIRQWRAESFIYVRKAAIHEALRAKPPHLK